MREVAGTEYPGQPEVSSASMARRKTLAKQGPKLDLTGAELADQAGLSAGMLSKIENGAVSASIDSQEALSRALNVPLTTFFASYEEQRDCSYVPRRQGVNIERPR